MSNSDLPNYPLLASLARSQYSLLGRKISYLEIGVCDGGSAKTVLDSGVVRMATLIDPWGTEYGGSGKHSAAHVIQRIGDSIGYTVILTGKSSQVLPILDSAYDMIYVDGDHSPEGAMFDLYHAGRLRAPNGVIVLDDVDNVAHPYLRRIATDFAQARGLTVTFHAVHCGVAELR